MPRFGHGAFLLCLENLYKKVTGRDMIYTALIGKPSEITYRHGEHVLQQQARAGGLPLPVRTIYCIGDNICTDIFGANLYNKYLERQRLDTAVMTQAKVLQVLVIVINLESPTLLTGFWHEHLAGSRITIYRGAAGDGGGAVRGRGLLLRPGGDGRVHQGGRAASQSGAQSAGLPAGGEQLPGARTDRQGEPQPPPPPPAQLVLRRTCWRRWR